MSFSFFQFFNSIVVIVTRSCADKSRRTTEPDWSNYFLRITWYFYTFAP